MSEEFLKAVQAGELTKVKSLLKAQPDLKDTRTSEGVHAAVLALYHGHADVSKAILAARPVLDVHAAATVGDLARVKQLVEADPKAVASYSADGFPPLALAAFLGHPAVVDYLLAKGADVNQAGKNRGRFTALPGAVSSGHRDVVERLVKAGADPNYWYQGGLTPTLVAAANGSIPILELLLAHGGDLSQETEQGKTAVSLAEEYKHPEIVDWLRKHGAK
ncbi:MAG TPA: ankyrin repeat domain-containing protein [Thermoplasmata archaeon]|nr:ankyrin repeat domain-containing protein [Thermoplasmata archaeon]